MRGKGFEREDIPHLFERFYAGKKTRRREAPGSRLALSRAVFERQNGTLAAYNLPRETGGAPAARALRFGCMGWINSREKQAGPLSSHFSLIG